MMARRLGWILSILLLVAAVAGWGAFRFVEHHIAQNMRPPSFAPPKEAAVDFPFQTLDGKPMHLADMKGEVVLVDLWGTWCIQCVVEMPELQRLYDHFRHDPQVQFLVISRMDTPEKVEAYAHRNSFDLPFFTMPDADIPELMRFNQFPSTFVYAKDGRLVAEHAGAAHWADPSVINFLNQLKSE
jgi:thiol-disulfide isomerase/thioredoxin